MSVRGIVKAALAAACIAAAAPATAAEASLAQFLDRLRLCQLPHLTLEGWPGMAAEADALVSVWTPQLLDDLARRASGRAAGVDRRRSRELQLTAARSYQAGATYAALAEWLRARRLEGVSRPALFRAAREVHAKRLTAEETAHCAVIKWGNFWPDVVLQPFPAATWRSIARLFEAPDAVNWPLNEAEAEALAADLHDFDELRELRALKLGVALFERQFTLLRDDRGGWIGNLASEPFVCTDEAVTASSFIRRLSDAGLLTRFEQIDGRFAHRGSLPLTDHFAVLLRNRRTGNFVVVDSWIEDGGEPPYIAPLDWWLADKPRRAFVGVGDADLDRALAADAVGRLQGPMRRRLDGLLSALEAEPRAASVPSGRPQFCPDGFHFCGPPPLAAWGRLPD